VHVHPAQVGSALTLLLASLRAVLPSAEAWEALSCCVLGTLFASSVVLRAAAFDVATASAPRAHAATHLADALTPRCAAWAAATLPPAFARLTPAAGGGSSAAVELAHNTLNALSLPAWARAGPMAAGALLAFMLPAAAADVPGKQQARRGSGRRRVVDALVRWFWLLQASATLLVLCLPSGAWVGTPQEALLSAAAPALACAAAALLLFCAAAPADGTSRWHSRSVAALLSWRGWRPLADASYGIHLFHFRLMCHLAAAAAPLPRQVTWPAVAALAAAGGLGGGVAAAAGAALLRLLTPRARAAKPKSA
jgi:peptidoglycan/LPS O-acetylase OafA/YrhL